MSELKKVLNGLADNKGRGAKGALAKFLHISPVHITRYLSFEDEYSNLNMPSKFFDKTAEFFGIDPIILYKADSRLSNVHNMLEKKPPLNTINIPIIESVAGCGASGMLDQLHFSDNSLLIDRTILPDNVNSKDLAIIRIVGDSMEPYLEENDWAVIQLRNSYDVYYVNGIYLVAHGESVQIKRCAFQPDGSCLLISDNQLYPTEKAHAGDWDVVGKIIARIKIGSPFARK